MAKVLTAKPRGIIAPHHTPRPFVVARFEPPERLAPFVAHFWSVRWHLPPGQDFVQENVPHPVVHLAFEAGEANVQGQVSQRFTRRIVGHGRVFGAHLQPGTCGALLDGPASSWVDRRIPLASWFPDTAPRTAALIEATSDDHERAAHLSAFLDAHLPHALPPTLADVAALAKRLSTDHSIHSVQQAAALVGVHPRTLQRRFKAAVGLSPKWLIRRRRIHEVLARLDAGTAPDLAGLAFELGWCDQAHFARDFRDVVGMSVSTYTARHRD